MEQIKMTDQNQFPAPIGDDNPLPPAPQAPVPQSPYSDWREERRAERAEWKTKGQNTSGWVGGVILIALGVIFLAQNLIPGFYIHNWWALFILFPAFGAFSTAYTSYRNAGRFTSAVRGSLTGGLILSFVAAIFLFNWSWEKLWPVFIILAGLGILLNTIGERR
jgi:hypothetical protein